MTASVQPVSSAAFASLIWELDSGAVSVFGPAPFPVSGYLPAAVGKRLARVLDYVRGTIVPAVLASLNWTQVTIVRRVLTADPGDPLDVTNAGTESSVYAVLSGATMENIEKGLLAASDFEALVPASALSTPLTKNDAIKIGGVHFDIVGIQGYPRVPTPVAYRFMLRRAA